MKSVVDVYEFLWENNIDIAYETIRGDFLIQMQNNSLQAERYVNFTIQDMNYALKVAEMLKKMSANVTLPDDFKDFFKGRYSSYKGLGDLMLKLYFFEVRINNNEDFNIFKLVLNSLKMLYDLISTGWASHSANSSYEEVSFIVQKPDGQWRAAVLCCGSSALR